MKFLSSVVDINQKEIVKKKILDKVILVKSLLVGDKKILNLECCDLAYHVCVISLALCHKNVFQLIVVKHLEELVSSYHLALCRRIHKCTN